MSTVGSWQGTLRSSSNNEVMPTKENAGMKRGPGRSARSALGDISNRGNAGTLAGKGGKKAGAISKPFSIAVEKEPEEDVEIEDVGEKGNAPALVITTGPEIHHTLAPVVDALDVGDLKNPKYAAEYVGDIYTHYRHVETRYMPDADYMSKQTDINEKMRALLIDWLIQVHVKFELLPQTLYLTVNLLDRFLEQKIVPRKKLQLVGCAAMLVASKYEEIYAPETSDFVSMSDRAFTSEELLKMEGILLNELDFHLTTPSQYTFLRRFMKIAGSSAKTQHFATFLIERSLQEYSMLKFKPSMLAASALLIAQGLTDTRKSWGPAHVRHSAYVESDLDECVDTIQRLYSQNQKNYLQAVNKKYASSKYMNVSTIPLR